MSHVPIAAPPIDLARRNCLKRVLIGVGIAALAAHESTVDAARAVAPPQSPRPNIDAIVRQFHVNFSNGEFEKNGALVDDSLTVNVNGGPANQVNGRSYTGRDQFVQWIKSYSVPFPGGTITDHDVIVAGHMAAIRFVFEGTHSGPLPLPDGTAVPPTGRKVRINGTEFFTFNDRGKLIHLETLSDDMALIGQVTKR